MVKIHYSKSNQPDLDEPYPRFWVADSHSVHTTRQFGLFRGRSLKIAPEILHAENDRRRHRVSEDSGFGVSPPPEDEIALVPGLLPTKQCLLGTTRATVSLASYGGSGKTQRYTWNWPLGNVRLVNTDDRFEVWMPIGHYQEDELWATVVGSEFTICLDSTNRSDLPRNSLGQNRFMIRTYTLPLNVDSHTAEFGIIQKSTFHLALEKDRPLKLAVASYGSDEESA